MADRIAGSPKFYTRTVTAGGKTRIIDMVMWTPKGLANISSTPYEIRSLQRASERRPESPLAQLWVGLKPMYDAWKQGHTLPETGTPLIAWAGMSEEQIEQIRLVGLQTIEDVAEAGDDVISRINLPQPRKLKDAAQTWLRARDSQVMTESMAAKDAKLAELEEQLEEMRRIVLEQQAERNEADGDKPRKRGRPALPRDEDGNPIRETEAA